MAEDQSDETPIGSDCGHLKHQLEYLTKQYGFYTGHMNQVFNFYLVASALIASAFVQSMSGPHPLTSSASAGIAVFGLALTICFALLHKRGFEVAGILDGELEAVERKIRVGFMRKRRATHGGRWWKRNTCVFAIIYLIVSTGFICDAAYACVRDKTQREPLSAIVIDQTVSLGNRE